MISIDVSLLCSVIHCVIVVIGIFAIVKSIKLLPRRLPEELFLAGLVVIHGLVPLFAGPAALYATASSTHFEAAVSALYMISGFVLARECFRGFLLKDLPVPRAITADGRNSFMIAMALFIAGFCALLLTLFLTRGAIQVGSGRLSGREQGTFVSAILANIGFLVLVAPWYFARQRRFVLCGILAVSLLAFFTLIYPGTRLYLVYVLGAIVSGYISSKSEWKHTCLVLSIAGVLLAVVVVLGYQARKFASFGLADSIQSGIAEVEFTEVPEPFNYHCQTILAVEHFSNSKDWLWGGSYWRILLAVVPEKYAFGLKPRDTNLIFGEACDFRFGESSVTIPPSTPGEGYINFGLFGSLLSGIIYSVAFRAVTRVWQSGGRLHFVVSPALFGVAIIAVRGQLYDLVLLIFVFCCTGCFIAWMVEQIFGSESGTKKRMKRKMPSRTQRSNRKSKAVVIDAT